MRFLKILVAFAPWLSFLIIGHGSLFRLKLGLVVALGLSVVMGFTRLHRGLILWAGLLFFAAAAVLVLGFENQWTVRHMGVLANGALAIATWLTLAVKKPFTLHYAREHTEPVLWDNPIFIRTNLIISAVWGLAFTLNTGLAWGKMHGFFLPDLGYELITYSLMVGAALFTSKYPARVRARYIPGA
ncbi:MAG: hypothetical protein KQJ78_06855 [Deltaproteobacteria bacterium]|nr:hypothetical protein [Deltaproteobacteria bacterium]